MAFRFQDFSAEWTLVEFDRKYARGLEAPTARKSLLFQGNYTIKPAWLQAKFELPAAGLKMASKTGKWREFGKKRENSGENSSPCHANETGSPKRKRRELIHHLLLLANKTQRCIT